MTLNIYLCRSAKLVCLISTYILAKLIILVYLFNYCIYLYSTAIDINILEILQWI